MLSLKNDFYVAFVKFHVKSQSVGVVVLAALTAYFCCGLFCFLFYLLIVFNPFSIIIHFDLSLVCISEVLSFFA